MCTFTFTRGIGENSFAFLDERETEEEEKGGTATEVMEGDAREKRKPSKEMKLSVSGKCSGWRCVRVAALPPADCGGYSQ